MFCSFEIIKLMWSDTRTDRVKLSSCKMSAYLLYALHKYKPKTFMFT